MVLVPASASSAARSLASAIVGFPATPSLLVHVIPAAGAPITRCAHVSAPVRTAMPVLPSASSALRSLASAKVGSPAPPIGLVMVKPAAGACRVRVTHVFAEIL